MAIKIYRTKQKADIKIEENKYASGSSVPTKKLILIHPQYCNEPAKKHKNPRYFQKICSRHQSKRYYQITVSYILVF